MTPDFTFVKQLAAGELVASTPDRVRMLEDLGLQPVIRGDQLALEEAPELLDANLIGAQLEDPVKQLLHKLDIHWTLNSTNTYLMDRIRKPNFHGTVCLAEQQTAGRGRRGRQWISPFGKNIYCSLGWQVPRASALDGLSLAVGVAVARSIADVGGPKVELKWPNDVLLAGGKVAGILVEMGAPTAGHVPLVIGVGINLQLSLQDARQIDQPWAVVSGVRRNDLVARLVTRMTQSIDAFAKEGFGPCREHWQRLDAHYDRPVSILQGEQARNGIARGVDEHGNLLLEVNGAIEPVNAGEVSLRAVAAP